MFDFSEMIHEERSKCLQALPRFFGTVLSAGCAGTWYFKWFETCTGHKGKHIGLELYNSKPTDLPSNVEWIANSVGDMRNVATSSVDLLFSGQNIEHLSQQDLTGFLLESSRVLKKDAMLVIDSPNRAVTQHSGYFHPEHSLELTSDEATALLEAAGFEVLEVRGVWLVIDPVSMRRFDITSCREGELSPELRTFQAVSNPEKSFIWWINARKKSPADEKLVRDRTSDIFWRNYNGFVGARFGAMIGSKTWNWGSSIVRVKHADNGYALYGPYIPLAAGDYLAVFHIKSDLQLQLFDAEIMLDVSSSRATVMHAKRILVYDELNLSQSWRQFSITFSLNAYTTGVEARVFCKNFSGSILGSVNFLPD